MVDYGVINIVLLSKNTIMLRLFHIIIFTAITTAGFSQTLNGTVYELDAQGQKKPLPGVNVYIEDRSAGTVTDLNGTFSLDMSGKTQQGVVFSFVGFHPDTIADPAFGEPIEVYLSTGSVLSGVIITDRQSGTYMMRMEPIVVQVIGEGELKRAACCSMAESFETNASVDVQYTDAVSGARQIQLLGLSGIYSQILFENMPYLRGLGIPYGLEYLPGPWLESIYVSKGTSSVINGYESVTGQINAELKKPEAKERTYLNLYADQDGRHEVNINQRLVLNSELQTMLFGHYSSNPLSIDENGDGFLDSPLKQQIHIANHWNFHTEDGGFESRFGIRGLMEERKGGQTAFFTSESGSGFYGTEISTKRIDAFAKTGYMFGNKNNTNIGFINSLSFHDMESFFGLKTYDASQLGYYSNLIFTTELNSPLHVFQAGLSLMYDEYDEVLNDSAFTTIERVPGVFAQYTFSIPEQITLIAGLRADQHNLFGTKITPRFHVRYPLNEHFILRASAGKGYRSPRIIVENIQLLASSRDFVFEEERKMEEAWNYGANLAFHYKLFKRDITVTAEYYRTSFINQIIVDYEKNPLLISVYNLDGRSWASHAQLEMSYALLKNMDVRAAVRFNDVKTTYNGILRDKYLMSRWKTLLTVSYLTKNRKWQFDATALLNGKSSLPDLSFHPIECRPPEESPQFLVIHSHITYNVKRWSFYLGAENLTNFMMHDPILGYEDPFGPYFDSSIIWGPVMGRKIYVGFRYVIDKPIKSH
jgi:outer membrane receptor for ferrienterochelin and colicins